MKLSARLFLIIALLGVASLSRGFDLKAAEREREIKDEILGNMERAARTIKSIEGICFRRSGTCRSAAGSLQRSNLFHSPTEACDKVRINYDRPSARL